MAQVAGARLPLPSCPSDALRASSNRSASTSCCNAHLVSPPLTGSKPRNGGFLKFRNVLRRGGLGAPGGVVSMALAVHHDGDLGTVNPSGLHETMLDNIAANEVFHDDDKGIACYETPLGEIVCEGIDDGPHFVSKELPQAKRMVGALQSGLDHVKARAMKVRRALRETEPLEAATCTTDEDGHVECDGLDESSDIN